MAAISELHSSKTNSTLALWKQPHRTRRLLARTNASSMVYNCDVCGKAFGYLFSMKKHREKHAPFLASSGNYQPSFAGEEHHLCIQCNRVFSCYASLKRHQLTTHTENGPVFNCPYCPYSNPFSWQVKRHIYKRHGLDDSFFCSTCKKFFRNVSERDRHDCSPAEQQIRLDASTSSSPREQIEIVENSRSHDVAEDGHDDDLEMKCASDQNETPCICPDCGQCLPSFEMMAKHQLTSHPNRNKTCSETSSGKLSGASPTSPANSTTSHGSYECTFCGISFVDPALWGLHSTMHDVNDLKKCNFCGRQAKDKYDFWRHFIDHSKKESDSEDME